MKSKSDDGAFRWIQPPPFLSGIHTTSCLYGINLDAPLSTKVAAFDLDGTVISSTFARSNGPRAPIDWWNKAVLPKLKELHDDGYTVVIISNQNIGDARLKSWKAKVDAIAQSLPAIPFRIFAATEKDIFRKPLPGMWYALESIYKSEKACIDTESSFYVGDAAGRPRDHAGSDRKFALNVGLKFFTPEEYFLGLKPASYKLEGFNVLELDTQGAAVLPSSTPIVPSKKLSSSPDIVLLIGYPSSGKTAFFKRHFQSSGYKHIEVDVSVFRGRPKYYPQIETAIKNGVNIVIETNDGSKKHRELFLRTAQSLSCTIRCFAFQAPMELAWHNNLYRAFGKSILAVHRDRMYEPWELREFIPRKVFDAFRTNYEEPKVEEGFKEIRMVYWRFEGDEEEKRFWNMWLQINGK